MTKIKDLHRKWMKDPEYRKEYDALEEEFALAAAVAKARTRSGLSQTRTGAAHENHAEHDRTPGKRSGPAVNADARSLRQGDRAPAQDQLRTRAESAIEL